MGTKCANIDLTNLIREKAKELWEKDGCKQGRDMEYWLQAAQLSWLSAACSRNDSSSIRIGTTSGVRSMSALFLPKKEIL